jgi:hypothetical protein
VLLGNVALRRELREELTGKRLLWDAARYSRPSDKIRP